MPRKLKDPQSRQYDIVLYGVTGFTGKLVGQYLAQDHDGQTAINWAVAGRSKDRVTRARDELQHIMAEHNALSTTDIGVIIASKDNQDSLHEMCSRTRVVISTVGPFAEHGEPLVKACIEAGTDYVDSTGEAIWVHDMINKYQEAAIEKGVTLCNMCGFDSIPADLGVMMIRNHARDKLKKDVEWVRAYVDASANASGGTVHSIMGIMAPSNLPTVLAHVLKDHTMLPEGFIASRRYPNEFSFGYSRDFSRYYTPFVMALTNMKVVRRTAALISMNPKEKPYSKKFTYLESQATNYFVIAVMYVVGIMLFTVACAVPGLRAILGWLFPQGTGPSESVRRKSWFSYNFVAKLEGSEQRVRAQVRGLDPGYDETSKMLAESALSLVLDRESLPDGKRVGFCTPAYALGPVLLNRLRAAGLIFKITEE